MCDISFDRINLRCVASHEEAIPTTASVLADHSRLVRGGGGQMAHSRLADYSRPVLAARETSTWPRLGRDHRPHPQHLYLPLDTRNRGMGFGWYVSEC